MAQMTAVMSCWKRNEFSDISCRKEMQAFAKCLEAKVRSVLLKTLYPHAFALVFAASKCANMEEGSLVPRPHGRRG